MLDPGSEKLPFTREEYAERVNQTAKAVRDAHLDFLVAFANKVMPGHVRYLSGYETRHGIHDWSMFLLDPQTCGSTLITNVSWEDLQAMSWVSDVRLAGLDRAGAVLLDKIPQRVRKIGVAG